MRSARGQLPTPEPHGSCSPTTCRTEGLQGRALSGAALGAGGTELEEGGQPAREGE